MDEALEKFEGWAILELLGHRRLGGMVTETQIAGAGFLRIDIPAEGDANPITQFCAPSSVYAITPVTEAMARAVARRNTPQPVSRWELPEATPPESENHRYVVEHELGMDIDDAEPEGDEPHTGEPPF